MPKDDVESFRRAVPTASIVEVDANHLTISVHPAAVEAIRTFLSDR